MRTVRCPCCRLMFGVEKGVPVQAPAAGETDQRRSVPTVGDTIELKDRNGKVTRTVLAVPMLDGTAAPWNCPNCGLITVDGKAVRDLAV